MRTNITLDIQKDTDVLVIGGGLAGCWAAIRARQLGARVTVVDKAVVSRSGASASAYYLLAPPPEDELAAWRQEIVESGSYLSDQEWVDILLNEQGRRIADMVAWGIPFERDKKGNLLRKAGRKHKTTRFVTSDGRLRMEVLKSKARELGVEFVEKVMITDLLTSDGLHPTKGSVVGAAGFHTRTGDFAVIRSKATIIASGPFHSGSNLSGDGQAAAFRSGAQLICMEFCTPPIPLLTDGKRDFQDLNVLFQSLDFRLLNSKGERFMEKYSPVLKERSDWTTICQGMAKEHMEGRGPITLDMSHAKQEDIDYYGSLHPGRMAPFIAAGVDLKKDRILCVAQSRLSSASGNGGIRIDQDGKTNLAGLFGTGSACKNLAQGTYAVGGMNLASCCVFGYRAGEATARESQQIQPRAPLKQQVEFLKKQIYAPVERNKGKLPDQVIGKMEDILSPVDMGIIKSQARIKKAITAFESMENEELSKIRARDVHELVKANETRNFTLFARLTFLAALERKESRYCHYLEEYPYQDDKDWLKWISIGRNGKQEIAIKIEDVPFDKYPVKPARRERIPAPVQFRY